jgi:hypothetical protein
VQQAKADLDAGKFKEARQKATEARQLGAAYGLFDDTPEQLLSQLDRMAGEPGARETEIAAAETAAEDNPFDEIESTPKVAEKRPASRDAGVVPSGTSGASARALFDQGKQALSRHDQETAYALFLQAYNATDKLDSRRAHELQDYLQELGRSRRQIRLASAEEESDAAPAGDSLKDATQQHLLQYERLKNDVRVATFRAERMREKQPEAALKILDKALAEIEQSDLPETEIEQLKRSLDRNRSMIEATTAERAPLRELKQANDEVKNAIKDRQERMIRIEQDYAKLVDEFNDLMKERRYAEAEIVAKKAWDLDSDNPVS